MAEIKYQYAYDENGVLVNINTLSRDESKLHEYRCIACGSVLAPRAIGSKCRRPHFYHKTLVECNGETYLHKLGKLYIKKRFDESEHFFVSYPAKLECSEKNCRLRNTNCTKDQYKHSEEFDLKQYYDTCTEEVVVSPYPFVADLLLTNSKNENVQPVLIEICVTHSCEEEKRNSGLRIIEVKIRNEADIESIIDNDVLKEKYSYSAKDKEIEFISFKRDICRKTIADIYRYVINKFTPEGYLGRIPCTRSLYKCRDDSEIELNVVWNARMDYIPDCIPPMWLYWKKGYRRCNICKYYGTTMYENQASCKYNAKYGRNPYPKMTDAESCRVFSAEKGIKLDGFYIEEVKAIDLNAKPEYRVIIAGSAYLCNDYEYFKSQCLKYLSEKMKTHEVVLVSGTARDIEQMTQDFAKEFHLQIQPHKAEWDKYENDNNAAFMSNERMVEYSDALIVFWNGRSRRIAHLIDTAKRKGIRVAEPKCN